MIYAQKAYRDGRARQRRRIANVKSSLLLCERIVCTRTAGDKDDPQMLGHYMGACSLYPNILRRFKLCKPQLESFEAPRQPRGSPILRAVAHAQPLTRCRRATL